MTVPDVQKLRPHIETLARDAGAVIMHHYNNGANVYTKSDGSVVTDADHAAEKVILARLAELTPDIPVVSEEAVEAGHIPDTSGGTFWTVDPLDGTKEFTNRTGAFVVAIALVVDHKPVLGVVYHPAMDLMYIGAGPGTGEKIDAQGVRTPLPSGTPPKNGVRVVLNESSVEIDKAKGYLTQQFGKAAKIDPKSGILRACQVADNTADVSLVHPKRREGRTKWWDVAPGHAIVEASGGSVMGIDGQPIVYNAPDLMVPPHVTLSARHVQKYGPLPRKQNAHHNGYRPPAQ
jgi:3'(2'), 5'-bisphosphate nucleotidase